MPRQQRPLARHQHTPRRVSRAATMQMRRQQRIALHPAQHRLVAGDLHVHQHHRVVRVRDDLLGHRVPPLRIAAHQPHRRRVVVDVVELIRDIALLLVEEGLAVGEQQLHVARLRPVDGRVIDLVQRAMRYRKPHPARSRVRRRHRVLLARSPGWRHPRRAKRRPIVIQPVIPRHIAHRPY